MKILMLAVVALAAELYAETPWVDFNHKIGAIRPELHSSGFGPMICSFSDQAREDVKAMGFQSARTHDWALVNSNQRVCDWHHIFPFVDRDASKAENYYFTPTDYLLKLTREEMGLDVFFRLGTSIEHSGPKVHFNSAIPRDLDKVAEVFAGTVRHYNRGWANGYNWNIKYWEIWNEPDGTNNMFCLPEGDQGETQEETKLRDEQRCEIFAQLFVKCIKRLKTEFGDTIKVGGPATCFYRPAYLRRMLQACKEAGVAPDFISWHAYTDDPWKMCFDAVAARKLCDEMGFPKCELIVNEWHYFGSNYGWGDLRSSDPARRAMVWEGPNGHNSIRSACFTLSSLAHIQDSKLDQAFYYGCSHYGAWGYKDWYENKYKVFYALKLFGSLMKEGGDRCAFFSDGLLTVFPTIAKDGRKRLLVVDYGRPERDISIAVKGVPQDAKIEVTLLDYTHNLEPLEQGVAFRNGNLWLRKPDFFSAAFLVTFKP